MCLGARECYSDWIKSVPGGVYDLGRVLPWSRGHRRSQAPRGGRGFWVSLQHLQSQAEELRGARPLVEALEHPQENQYFSDDSPKFYSLRLVKAGNVKQKWVQLKFRKQDFKRTLSHFLGVLIVSSIQPANTKCLFCFRVYSKYWKITFSN